ncbi:MAG: efflux RND transporter periplasmic adaptor subunit [Candidatus Accumulibacter sp.]|jgi:biotin carboxyl carrier protein|nr:efflux RND transporter periplasmic adaptor subunit [Accumulibacter sp.]
MEVVGGRLDTFIAVLLGAASREERLQAACSLGCAAADAVGVAVLFRQQGRVGVGAAFPLPSSGETPPPWLSSLAKTYGQMLAENCQTVVLAAGGQAEWGVFVPLPGDWGGSLTLAACVRGGRQARLQGVSDILQLVRAALLILGRAPGAGTDAADGNSLADVLHILAEVQEARRFFKAAATLCAESVVRLGCRRAALGMVKAGGVKVVALDQMDNFARGSRPVRRLEEAMQEALDQDAMGLYDRDKEGEGDGDGGAAPGSGAVTRAARELAISANVRRVLALPMRDGEGVHFVMLFLTDDARLDARRVDVLSLICRLAAPHLLELQRAEEFFLRRFFRWLLLRSADLFGPRRTVLKLSSFVLGSGLLLSLLLQGDLIISAPLAVEGVYSYTHTAPMDGWLAEVLKRPGDAVNPDELLGRLDATEIQLEIASLEAQRNISINQRLQYMQEGKDAEAAISALETEKLSADLDWARQRLDMVELRSSVEGFVVSEDLFSRLGQPVRRGQELFEVTDTASMRIIVHVDESDISELSAAQAEGPARGEFTLTAYPSLHVPFTVERIHPFADVEGDSNGFEVRGRVDDIPRGLTLRPGMEGHARIVAGAASYFALWTRKLADRIRLLWWRWT